MNLVILGTSALLPFSTGVLAGAYGVDAPASNRAAAVVLYALVAMLASAAWVPVFGHLDRHPELLANPEDRDLLRAQRSRPWVGVVSYTVGGLLGWLVSPYLAIAAFLWMIVYHTVTSEGLHANPVARALTPAPDRPVVEREAAAADER
jgi:uncharacterized membrane protein